MCVVRVDVGVCGWGRCGCVWWGVDVGVCGGVDAGVCHTHLCA